MEEKNLDDVLQKVKKLAVTKKRVLTDEEIAGLERETVERNERLLLRPALRTTVSNVDRGVDGAPGAYNNVWLDGGRVPTTGLTD